MEIIKIRKRGGRMKCRHPEKKIWRTKTYVFAGDNSGWVYKASCKCGFWAIGYTPKECYEELKKARR
jgi:hypothetical protein